METSIIRIVCAVLALALIGLIVMRRRKKAE
jgi:preprotein translocase subunit SecG